MRRHAVIVLFLLLAARPALASPTTSGTASDAGILHVTNPDTARLGRDLITLEEVWRRGDEDDEVLFMLPTDIDFDAEDNTYVLDARSQEVHVFSPDGQHLRTLGGKGEGPGETRGALQMFFTGRDTLCLVESFPAKVVRMLRDGTPLSSVPLETEGGEQTAMLGVGNARQGGRRLAIAGFEYVPDPEAGALVRRSVLRLYDLRGHIIATLAEHEAILPIAAKGKVRERDFLFPQYAMDIDSLGCVHASLDRDAYRIGVYDTTGTLARIVERDYPPFRRTKLDRHLMRSKLRKEASVLYRQPEIETEETEITILAIRCRPDGTTWVLTGRGIGHFHRRPKDPFVLYDVLSPSGEFVRQVGFQCDDNPGLDLPELAPDGGLCVIRNFWSSVVGSNGRPGIVNVGRDDETVQVIRYRPDVPDKP